MNRSIPAPPSLLALGFLLTLAGPLAAEDSPETSSPCVEEAVATPDGAKVSASGRTGYLVVESVPTSNEDPFAFRRVARDPGALVASLRSIRQPTAPKTVPVARRDCSQTTVPDATSEPPPAAHLAETEFGDPVSANTRSVL